jgi:hypothetical protein
MTLAICAVIAIQASPRPTDGPALAPSFLGSLKPQKISVGTDWTKGLYSVAFEYHTSKPAKAITALCTKKNGWQVSSAPNAEDFQAWRNREGVYQNIFVIRRTLHYVGNNARGHYSGKKQDLYTTIGIRESIDAGGMPKRWYKGAISPRPPIEMIDLPFLRGAKTESVTLESFDNLMSSKGIMYPGTDAAVYGAVVKQPYREVRKLAADWAAKNGYTRTNHMGFFKPRVKVFEITITPYSFGPKETAFVTLYTSNKPAEHPVIREKT